MHQGGLTDGVPIWAQDGEFVMSRSAVTQYGVGTMHAMNRGQLGGAGSSFTTHVTFNHPVVASSYSELSKFADLIDKAVLHAMRSRGRISTRTNHAARPEPLDVGDELHAAKRTIVALQTALRRERMPHEHFEAALRRAWTWAAGRQRAVRRDTRTRQGHETGAERGTRAERVRPLRAGSVARRSSPRARTSAFAGRVPV